MMHGIKYLSRHFFYNIKNTAKCFFYIKKKSNAYLLKWNLSFLMNSVSLNAIYFIFFFFCMKKKTL